jgi:hypothetical protein
MEKRTTRFVRAIVPERERAVRSKKKMGLILMATIAFAVGYGEAQSPPSTQPTIESPNRTMQSAPFEKDGLSVVIEPIRRDFKIYQPLTFKVTFRNVSKALFRFPYLAFFRTDNHELGNATGYFWQLRLQEEATGDTYTEKPFKPQDYTVEMAEIAPGEEWVQTVELPQGNFRHDDPARPDADEYIHLGPGHSASGVGGFPEDGAYKVSVIMQFPPKDADDRWPTPMWNGGSIQTNPVEITISEK